MSGAGTARYPGPNQNQTQAVSDRPAMSRSVPEANLTLSGKVLPADSALTVTG